METIDEAREYVNSQSWGGDELQNAVTDWRQGKLVLPDGQFAQVARWAEQFAARLPDGATPLTVALVLEVRSPGGFGQSKYALGLVMQVLPPGIDETDVGTDELADVLDAVHLASGMNLELLRPLTLAAAIVATPDDAETSG